MKGKYPKGKTIEYDGSQLSPPWAYINADAGKVRPVTDSCF